MARPPDGRFRDEMFHRLDDEFRHHRGQIPLDVATAYGRVLGIMPTSVFREFLRWANRDVEAHGPWLPPHSLVEAAVRDGHDFEWLYEHYRDPHGPRPFVVAWRCTEGLHCTSPAYRTLRVRYRTSPPR